jgi:hypothetical protein
MACATQTRKNLRETGPLAAVAATGSGRRGSPSSGRRLIATLT